MEDYLNVAETPIQDYGPMAVQTHFTSSDVAYSVLDDLMNIFDILTITQIDTKWAIGGMVFIFPTQEDKNIFELYYA
jgi:hypothetical protein